MPANRFVIRSGTQAQWTNEILALGEPGFDATNSVLKVGDGIQKFSALNIAATFDTTNLDSLTDGPTNFGKVSKAMATKLNNGGTYPPDLTEFVTVPTTGADVGLGNVDNTADVDKPISDLTQAELDLKAPIADPTFTGVPLADTAASGTSTTQLATTAFAVGEAVAAQAAAEVTAAGELSDHVSVEDPHTGYLLESAAGGAALLDVGTVEGTVAAGDDARLSDTRDPKTHKTSHQAGGSDAIASTTPAVDTIPMTSHTDATLDAWLSGASLIKFTPEGGLAVRMVNASGGASIKGYVVDADTSATKAVKLSPIDSFDPIGVFYEADVANGQPVWVVVAGLADVYFGATVVIGRYARVSVSADTGKGAGVAISAEVPSNPNVAADNHFREIGHCLEARTGAGLAKIVMHFN